MARVEFVHLAAEPAAPMRAVAAARALARVGLRGDRYASGRGYWQGNRVARDLTLVEAEALEALAAEQGIELEPGATRRNVTTRGVRLNELAGRLFWVGDVLCRGAELCEPCAYLERLLGQPVLRPLVHRGGLRAELLTDGTIGVGDVVEPAVELAGVGIVVLRGGKVLLGRRLGDPGRGTWSFPGGKPLERESLLDCARRELEEETGLRAEAGWLVGETLDAFPESRSLYRTRFVRVEQVRGEPAAREPEKTEAWSWHDWRTLPEPLFRPVASLVASGYDPIPA